jgi:hypothetical protein
MRASSLLVGLLVCGIPGRALAGSPETPSVVQTERSSPEPPTGKPMFGWGVFGATFGILNIGYGIPMAIFGFGHASAEASIPIAFGAAFVVLGSLGIHYGKRRRAVWRTWADDNPRAAQHLHARRRSNDRAGTGMLISGSIMICGGLTTLPIGIVHPLTFADNDPRSPVPAIVGATVSGASIIAGFTLLAIGADLRGAENRALRGMTRQLVPTGWADAHGWGFGVAGRF